MLTCQYGKLETCGTPIQTHVKKRNKSHENNEKSLKKTSIRFNIIFSGVFVWKLSFNTHAYIFMEILKFTPSFYLFSIECAFLCWLTMNTLKIAALQAFNRLIYPAQHFNINNNTVLLKTQEWKVRSQNPFFKIIKCIYILKLCNEELMEMIRVWKSQSPKIDSVTGFNIKLLGRFPFYFKAAKQV